MTGQPVAGYGPVWLPSKVAVKTYPFIWGRCVSPSINDRQHRFDSFLQPPLVVDHYRITTIRHPKLLVGTLYPALDVCRRIAAAATLRDAESNGLATGGVEGGPYDQISVGPNSR